MRRSVWPFTFLMIPVAGLVGAAAAGSFHGPGIIMGSIAAMPGVLIGLPLVDAFISRRPRNEFAVPFIYSCCGILVGALTALLLVDLTLACSIVSPPAIGGDFGTAAVFRPWSAGFS